MPCGSSKPKQLLILSAGTAAGSRSSHGAKGGSGGQGGLGGKGSLSAAGSLRADGVFGVDSLHAPRGEPFDALGHELRQMRLGSPTLGVTLTLMLTLTQSAAMRCGR